MEGRGGGGVAGGGEGGGGGAGVHVQVPGASAIKAVGRGQIRPALHQQQEAKVVTSFQRAVHAHGVALVRAHGSADAPARVNARDFAGIIARLPARQVAWAVDVAHASGRVVVAVDVGRARVRQHVDLEPLVAPRRVPLARAAVREELEALVGAYAPLLVDVDARVVDVALPPAPTNRHRCAVTPFKGVARLDHLDREVAVRHRGLVGVAEPTVGPPTDDGKAAAAVAAREELTVPHLGGALHGAARLGADELPRGVAAARVPGAGVDVLAYDLAIRICAAVANGDVALAEPVRHVLLREDRAALRVVVHLDRLALRVELGDYPVAHRHLHQVRAREGVPVAARVAAVRAVAVVGAFFCARAEANTRVSFLGFACACVVRLAFSHTPTRTRSRRCPRRRPRLRTVGVARGAACARAVYWGALV